MVVDDEWPLVQVEAVDVVVDLAAFVTVVVGYEEGERRESSASVECY